MNIVDVIRALAGFGLLAAIGLGILALTRAGRNQSAKGIGSTALVILAIQVRGQPGERLPHGLSGRRLVRWIQYRPIRPLV